MEWVVLNMVLTDRDYSRCGIQLTTWWLNELVRQNERHSITSKATTKTSFTRRLAIHSIAFHSSIDLIVKYYKWLTILYVNEYGIQGRFKQTWPNSDWSFRAKHAHSLIRNNKKYRTYNFNFLSRTTQMHSKHYLHHPLI